MGEKTNNWDKLYNKAKEVQNGREISPFIYGGQVSAAIMTDRGNIYVGVCVDATCGLAVCAERNAIFNMITNGESKIDKMVAITSDNRVGAPCGVCRELMMQLHKDSGEIEVLMNYETMEIKKLKELVPDWWGIERFK